MNSRTVEQSGLVQWLIRYIVIKHDGSQVTLFGRAAGQGYVTLDDRP